jgi:hypothetical protein
VLQSRRRDRVIRTSIGDRCRPLGTLALLLECGKARSSGSSSTEVDLVANKIFTEIAGASRRHHL